MLLLTLLLPLGVQGEALTPAQLAAQESLMPPPLQRLLRCLRLGGGYGPLVAVAPRLASVVRPLPLQLAVCLFSSLPPAALLFSFS